MEIRLSLKISIIAFIVFFLTTCVQKEIDEVKVENENAKIVSAINAVIGWAANKDTSLLYSVIANDSNFLEVHPNNRIVNGIEDFRKGEDFWLNPDFKAVRYKISDLKVNVSKSGSVAWFFCMLDDINEWKGEPANWENTRWTGVLEKRDGQWRMVQQHFSFAQK